MQPAQKIISLNIEKDRHLERILSFLEQEKPDILCLQEVFRPGFELIKNTFGYAGVFDAQVTLNEKDGIKHEQGIAILSKHPILSHQSIPYTNHTNQETVDLRYHSENDVDKNKTNRQYTRRVLFATIKIGYATYNIATTHFTWGYYGHLDTDTGNFIWQIDEASTKEQEEDARRLLDIFASMGEFVFCADTNCPRGEKVFAMFAKNLKDNVPEVYRTSIDGRLHRAGPLPLMVDCLFTTPGYNATNVILKDGVSDHMAVVGEINKI